MRVVAALGLCLALLSGACDRAASSGAEMETSALQADLPGFVRHDARLRVPHSGLRRLELAPVSGQRLAFDERIATDGNGHYALEPAQPLEPDSLDWNGFELLHHLREGFFFRYRDFAVRDPRVFARNWRVVDLQQTAVVAGRRCARFRVERLRGGSSLFELSVDLLTDLVLASEEYDESGQVIASMTYHSIDLAPDLSSQVWHQAGNDETRLDSSRGLGEQIDARVLEPRLLPDGYAPLEASVVNDGSDSWLKLTYSDGVQPLFFLHVIDSSSRGKAAQVGDKGLRDPPNSTSAVIVCQIGTATAVQGQVDGFDLIAVGKVPQVQLLDLIESALP